MNKSIAEYDMIIYLERLIKTDDCPHQIRNEKTNEPINLTNFFNEKCYEICREMTKYKRIVDESCKYKLASDVKVALKEKQDSKISVDEFMRKCEAKINKKNCLQKSKAVI